MIKKYSNVPLQMEHPSWLKSKEAPQTKKVKEAEAESEELPRLRGLTEGAVYFDEVQDFVKTEK